jgi:hypothetical protein
LIPKGYINVQVKYNGQCESLKLYLVQKGGPALFGQEWLKKINLDWKNLEWINKISVSGNTSENLDFLLKEYSNVFSDGIGCAAEIKVTYGTIQFHYGDYQGCPLTCVNF